MHSATATALALLAATLSLPASAQGSAADSVTWWNPTARWGHGATTDTYDVGAQVSFPEGPWVGSWGGGLRVVDVTDAERPGASPTDVCCTAGFAVHLDLGRRLGRSPVVVRAGATGWVPLVVDGRAGGGDLRAEVALVPRRAGPTVSAGAYVTGARGYVVDLGDRGVAVSVGYQFPVRERPDGGGRP